MSQLTLADDFELIEPSAFWSVVQNFRQNALESFVNDPLGKKTLENALKIHALGHQYHQSLAEILRS